jgi:hypothetical protein
MAIHGYPGGVISSTAPTIAPTGASGVWTTETQLQNSANWPSADYITRSLRFNSADSAYLSRTPASAGNRKIWTWSGWVKRAKINTTSFIFTSRPSLGAAFFLYFDQGTGDNALRIAENGGGSSNLITTQLFRDVSAWYHIVVAWDTTQATASNRVKIYVNGVQVTSFATSTYPTLNADSEINNTSIHSIGSQQTYAAGNYFDGYMADITFVDGLALTPSSFGFTDPNTGEWQPQVYHGSYGTNGFFLRFANNTGTTSTTLGLDSSGNGNNWTPSAGFSVAAGSGNDSLVDSPSSYGTDTGVGGEVRGNYCTLNPLNTTTGTLSNGNLQWVSSASAGYLSTGTIAFDIADSTNKYYFEFKLVSGDCVLGMAPLTTLGSDTNRTGSYGYYGSGQKYSGTTASTYGASFTSGDVISVAVGAGKITFYKNGVSQGDAFTGLTGYFVSMIAEVSGTFEANFGQRPFLYTAPAGFKCLVDTNLNNPTIGATSTTRADDYFNAVLWSGTSTGTNRSISGVGFQPDFVWIKARNQPYRHALYDVIRGSAADKYLSTANSDTEGASNFAGLYGYVSAFESDGFQVTKGTDPSSSYAWVNETGGNYVSWNWKANGAGSSNTAGSITSTVSANTTSGFSIVTYTGNATAGATVGHGLNVAPSFVILKSRSVATNWYVWSTGLTSAEYEIYLNLTDAQGNPAFTFLYDAAPTATTFSLPTAGYGSNNSSATYVAYCFASVPGYSAFGKYTGNGSSDGTFVYTGFRPRFVMVKYSSGVGSWVMYDSARSTYNEITINLIANTADAEATNNACDFLSNGFKLRSTFSNSNASSGTYIYAAFAEFPFKFARAR